MSHITELVLKVIEQRIIKKIDNEVSRLKVDLDLEVVQEKAFSV